MTHEELLKTLSGEEPIYVRDILYSALRAIVEMHYPWEITWAVKQPFISCYSCGEEYPCPTIQAIEKELDNG